MSAQFSNHALPEPAKLLGPRSASQRVLIVEDEKRLREMLCASITEMGLVPTTAASAEAALKLVDQYFFALAVVDLNLPGMGGLELCEKLASMKLHIQMIILTGFGDLEAAQRAIRLDVADFLTKPCSMDDLEHALNRGRLRWLDRWALNDPAASPRIPTLPQQPAPAQPIAAEPAPELPASTDPGPIDQMERQMILAALARHNGNRQEAAAALGISVRKIYYRLQQYQRQGLLPDTI
jgi:DNA-binding NtrC family response regulator